MYRFFALIAVSAFAFIVGRQTVDRPPTIAPPTAYRTYCPVTGNYWEPPSYLRDKLWNRPTAAQ